MDQGLGGVDPGPCERRLAQALFDAMAEVVLQPPPLSFGLVADDDSVVSPFPEGSAPFADTAADLLGEVTADVMHEPGQLLLVADDDQEVGVI